MTTTKQAHEEIAALYPQVHKRLVETGEWDRILLTLTRKLNESGWLDDIHNQSKESAKTASPLNFSALFAEFQPDAQTSVPLTVKSEVENMIRQYLESQFQS